MNQVKLTKDQLLKNLISARSTKEYWKNLIPKENREDFAKEIRFYIRKHYRVVPLPSNKKKLYFKDLRFIPKEAIKICSFFFIATEIIYKYDYQ